MIQKRCSRTLRIGYFHHITGKQQQICTNKLWYLFVEILFSDGYTTEDGEELSVREIKRILKECVDTEDKEKPYTDDELAETLKTKGYP